MRYYSPAIEFIPLDTRGLYNRAFGNFVKSPVQGNFVGSYHSNVRCGCLPPASYGAALTPSWENIITDLTEILNWRRLDHRITLSGQPTEEQLAQIKESGVSCIINLGPHTNDGALADETGTVASLGMTYIYIPVDFSNPTDEDYSKFCDAMDLVEDSKVHVHCIYNARVSAFFYRYAQSGKKYSDIETYALMDSIWRPGGVWAKFIGNDDAIDQPNHYSGYDY